MLGKVAAEVSKSLKNVDKDKKMYDNFVKEMAEDKEMQGLMKSMLILTGEQIKLLLQIEKAAKKKK